MYCFVNEGLGRERRALPFSAEVVSLREEVPAWGDGLGGGLFGLGALGDFIYETHSASNDNHTTRKGGERHERAEVVVAGVDDPERKEDETEDERADHEVVNHLQVPATFELGLNDVLDVSGSDEHEGSHDVEEEADDEAGLGGGAVPERE